MFVAYQMELVDASGNELPGTFGKGADLKTMLSETEHMSLLAPFWLTPSIDRCNAGLRIKLNTRWQHQTSYGFKTIKRLYNETLHPINRQESLKLFW